MKKKGHSDNTYHGNCISGYRGVLVYTKPVSGHKGVSMPQWAQVRTSRHEDVSVGIKEILPNTYL